MLRSIVIVLGMLIATPASSETVNVKYRGIVDLKPFTCRLVDLLAERGSRIRVEAAALVET